MKKLSLLFCFAITFGQTNAQNYKEQQQVKSIILQAYESVSQSTRQWFADVSPAGDIDSAYIRRKLIEKFGIGPLGDIGDLFATMMAYLQLAAKETRDDSRVQHQLKRLLTASKAEKIKMNNESVDQGMKEAREKAERAMDAAVTSLVMGIVSGLAQISFTESSSAGQKIVSLAVYVRKLELQLGILRKKEK